MLHSAYQFLYDICIRPSFRILILYSYWKSRNFKTFESVISVGKNPWNQGNLRSVYGVKVCLNLFLICAFTFTFIFAFSWGVFYKCTMCDMLTQNRKQVARALCDPTRANEALWERYQNWHFKFNILFNIWGTFWDQNCFHIIFLSKIIDNLISTCLITLKINYQDMGRQSYWFVHKPIEDIKNNWSKT